MNKSLVIKLIGSMLLIESALMIISTIVALIYGGDDIIWLALCTAIIALIGLAMSSVKPRDESLRAREGLATVSLGWIVFSALGALPFFLSGYIPNYIDCLFETVSGFTTTGATILSDVEALPRGLLFWRSLTHWAGGMGVLVLTLAIIPRMGTRSIYLMRAESPGPSTDKLVPRIYDYAKLLYKIYLGLTVIMVIALLICGLDLYDSLIHTFGAAGTGGFSNYTDSVAQFDSAAVDIVIGVFMALFGVNFAAYFYLLRGEFNHALKNTEVRCYIAIMLSATLIIAINILPLYDGSLLKSLRYSFFQVSSVMTTTGYATANFDLWPQLSRVTLMILMLIGACAGSTGGGIKVVRLQILIKNAFRDVRKSINPKRVISIKLDGRAIDEQTVSGVHSFFFAYMLIIAVSVAIVAIDGFSFDTSFSSVLACISNIGPGMDLVGPVGSFTMLSPLSKIVLTLDMLLGRLEIFPVLMLMLPSTWKR